VAPPRWAEDEDFHLDYHVRRVSAPGKGSWEDLLAVARPIAMQAFDRDRPLWEFTQVDGLADGRAGAVLKLHHAISDGVGLVRMTAGMVERSADPEPPSRSARDEPAEPEVVAEPWSPLDETLDALRYQASRRVEQGRSAAGAVLQGLGRLARTPLGALQEVAEVAGSAGRLLAPASEPMSPLMRGRSLQVRLHAFGRPLAGLRAAGKSVGGTVNDAFVAGIAGGLARYHAGHGKPVDELRMSMPVNLRHGEKARKAGNQFAPVRFAVPLGIEDPRERMREIHRRVAKERSEPSLPALDLLAGALNRLPGPAAVAAFGGMLKSVDFVTSNVPGPDFPVWMSGARIEAMIPFGPLSGAAANITLFSYDGQVQVGVTSDGVAIPDPERLLECLETGMDEVLAVGAPGGPGGV
jgi:WS/DGAT/MGAT family acyltransferase